MQEPWANINGASIPASQAVISVADAGFVLGATVSEQLRTCGGKLFLLDEHLARLDRSLAIAGIDPGCSLAEIGTRAQELAARNHPLLATGDDLGLAMFVTPGIYPTFGMATQGGPTVGLHTYPLPFALWAKSYAAGASLVTVATQPVPSECWPVEMKCRSRMHYFLADQQARAKQPGARALLVDAQGRVHDTSTATLIAYFEREGFVIPPAERILPGISAAYTQTLAERLGLRWTRRDLSLAELRQADELLLASTPFCLLSVTQLDGTSVGTGQPGLQYSRLMTAWSESVGIDLVEQAQRFTVRAKSTSGDSSTA